MSQLFLVQLPIANEAPKEDLGLKCNMSSCRHLRDLLDDPKRSDLLYQEHKSEHGTLIADFSRQRVTEDTLKLLIDLANKANAS